MLNKQSKQVKQSHENKKVSGGEEDGSAVQTRGLGFPYPQST